VTSARPPRPSLFAGFGAGEVPVVRSLVPASISAPYAHGDVCTLVVFGAAGDLARKKLLPAIYLLAAQGLLAKETRVVGVGIEPLDDARFCELFGAALGASREVGRVDPQIWSELRARCSWVSGDLTDAAVYAELRLHLETLETARPANERHRLFYLAVPPVIFAPIATHLAESGVCPRTAPDAVGPWRRLILEKPFGHDLESAQALNARVLSLFGEHQCFRIDHYLGKETVQNLLVARSANALIEAVWSREHVSHVQITAAETVGLEGRAGYYERAGVVRDMFQNHLLQLLALVAMEPPETTSADAIRDEKVRALRAIQPLVEDGRTRAVRAQYRDGELDGNAVVGYRAEPGASPASTTPTYAALRLFVDTDRWRGVPFYLRSGKRMAKRATEIALVFRPPKRLMYAHVEGEFPEPNALVFRIQPDDGMSLRISVKVPGAALALTPGLEITPVELEFAFADAFGEGMHSAYATLLLDAMRGDATLFTRSDEVEAGWALTDPLLRHWEQRGETHIPTYAAGSWGPHEADELLAADGFAWRKS